MWLREIPVWETFEPTTCNAQAEQPYVPSDLNKNNESGPGID